MTSRNYSCECEYRELPVIRTWLIQLQRGNLDGLIDEGLKTGIKKKVILKPSAAVMKTN